MRKIMAAAAAVAFASTMFASAPASADCVEFDIQYVVIAWGPWGPIYGPTTGGVDTNPRDCVTTAETVVDELLAHLETE
ncbi:MAG TPA: hypothetical protein VNA20_03740 [Frankiaceae bacterium]|nr:hypothetical protein [Frankiaceae bacterium]